MASHTSITAAQVRSIHLLLEAKLPDSIDEAVEEFGREEAFRLYNLRDRFRPEEPKSKGK